MMYFTREGFGRLANQNRGHIRVMLESLITTVPYGCNNSYLNFDLQPYPYCSINGPDMWLVQI